MEEGEEVIIVEGPDSVGKSHWCEWLADRHNYIVFHHGAEPETEDTYTLYESSVEHPCTNVVLDRWFYSELVYNIVKRYHDEVRITYAMKRQLEHLARQRQAVVLLLQPPYGLCASRWHAHRAQEWLSDEQEYLQSYRAYEYLEWWVDLPILRVGKTPNHYQELLDQIHSVRAIHYGGTKPPSVVNSEPP
jgi:thymidylate kinase